MSKQLVNIFTNPMSGLIGAAIQRSPAGMVYGAANVATKAITGKTIPQHAVTAAQNAANQPPHSNKGQSNPALAQQKMIRGAAVQDLEKLSSANPNLARGDFDRTARAKGGRVSYKSVFDMER